MGIVFINGIHVGTWYSPRSADAAVALGAATNPSLVPRSPNLRAGPGGVGASLGERTIGAPSASRRWRVAVGDCIVHRFWLELRS